MSSAHSNRHAPESRQRAVQLCESRRPVTYAEVARELGIDAGTLSKWVAQASPAEDADDSGNPFQVEWQPFSGHFFQRLSPANLNSTGLM